LGGLKANSVEAGAKGREHGCWEQTEEADSPDKNGSRMVESQGKSMP